MYLWIVVFLDWLLLDNIEYTVLKCFFVFAESVLFPCVVVCFHVKSIPSHTFFEETNDVLVVRVLFELQSSAVLHVLFELRRQTLAELIKSSLNLLFFNLIVLLILCSAGKSLPRQAAFKEI